MLSEVVLVLLLLISGCCFCRCLLDTDLPVVQSDTQPCRYQKKRHSENFGTEPGLHSPKTTSCETVDDVWRPQGSSLLADGLPVEGFGIFQMEKKPLKLDSRTDWCQYGQGKKRFVELRR